ALQSGEAEQLVQALAGRGGRRKLTPEIRAFVRVRFPEIYGQSRVGYSQRLRAEIERVFAVKLSGECLRPFLKSLRAELRQGAHLRFFDVGSARKHEEGLIEAGRGEFSVRV